MQKKSPTFLPDFSFNLHEGLLIDHSGFDQ